MEQEVRARTKEKIVTAFLLMPSRTGEGCTGDGRGKVPVEEDGFGEGGER